MNESMEAQSFLRWLADALMSAAPFPFLLLVTRGTMTDAAVGLFPFIIVGFYLMTALTMAVAAWRMLRGLSHPRFGSGASL